jgi:L-serine/L-threonine ammonia-lyase
VGLHVETPLIESLAMSESLAGRAWLKLESCQPTGSFKARGIGHACEAAVARGAVRLISSSGGNAGLAVAYSGRRLGVPVTVVVPETTKRRAIDLIGAEGAEVVVTGENWDAAHAHATELTDEHAAYLHPFDDPDIWRGHSTLVDEVAAAGLTPDAVVLSVGGGGLLCGVAEGMARHGWSDVPIVAVETEGAASLNACVTAGARVSIERIDSIATSLGATRVCDRAWALTQTRTIVSHVVTDAQAVEACHRFLGDHRIVVEPACGASLYAAYAGCEALGEARDILVIVCGGVGATVEQLNAWR